MRRPGLDGGHHQTGLFACLYGRGTGKAASMRHDLRERVLSAVGHPEPLVNPETTEKEPQGIGRRQVRGQGTERPSSPTGTTGREKGGHGFATANLSCSRLYFQRAPLNHLASPCRLYAPTQVIMWTVIRLMAEHFANIKC